MRKFFGTKHYQAREGKFVNQVHGSNVIVVTDALQDTHCLEGDALVTQLQGIDLCVVTADCVPILLHDEAGIVAAVHAGWRGASTGIIQNTIDTMKKLGGIKIAAFIGPCIRQSSYEVDDKFYSQFISQDKNNDQFFKGNFFDLPGYCKHILTAGGVSDISDDEVDTYSNPEDFYSYRYYSKNNLLLEKSQRQVSMVRL